MLNKRPAVIQTVMKSACPDTETNKIGILRKTHIVVRSLQELVVIKAVVVLLHLAPDPGGVHPCHKVFHGPRHEKGGVCDCEYVERGE